MQYEPAVDSVRDMVERFIGACDAKIQASSSSSSLPAAGAAAALEAVPYSLETPFDNLDLLFTTAHREDPVRIIDDGCHECGKGFDVQDSEGKDDYEEGKGNLKVYFPEIALSYALEVTFHTWRVTFGLRRVARDH